MSNPRRIAYNLILEWSEKQTFPNLALKKALRSVPEERDRRFISALVYGVVERKITLDHYVAKCSTRSIDRLPAPVLCALRLGIYQMFYLEIPDAAACDTSVEMIKSGRYAYAVGFVNAILRRCAREKESLMQLKKTDFSIRYSIHPQLVDRLLQQYDKASFVSMMEALSLPNRSVFLYHNFAKGGEVSFVRKMEAEGITLSKTHLPHLFCAENGFSIEDSSAYREGWFHVVGLHSAEAALFMPSNAEAIDLCAAPGGKTFIMASLTDRPIRSCDVHPHKVQLLKNAARRLGYNHVEAICNDATIRKEQWIDSADFVLCDVPCSGLGIMGKKPDIKYKTDDIGDLLAIQYEILKNGASYLHEHGRLVYSTCTLDQRENEKQIERFLAEHPSFSLDTDAITGGMVTYFIEAGKDGFFIAVLKKG